MKDADATTSKARIIHDGNSGIEGEGVGVEVEVGLGVGVGSDESEIVTGFIKG